LFSRINLVVIILIILFFTITDKTTEHANCAGDEKFELKIKLRMIAITRLRVVRDSKSSAAAAADNTTHARERHRTVNTGCDDDGGGGGCGGGGYSTFGGDDGAWATGRRRT